MGMMGGEGCRWELGRLRECRPSSAVLPYLSFIFWEFGKSQKSFTQFRDRSKVVLLEWPLWGLEEWVVSPKSREVPWGAIAGATKSLQ